MISTKRNNRPTLDEALRPIKMTCCNCKAEMIVYPDEGTGKGVCPNCSPNWLGSFALFCLNQMRLKYNLKELETP